MYLPTPCSYGPYSVWRFWVPPKVLGGLVVGELSLFGLVLVVALCLCDMELGNSTARKLEVNHCIVHALVRGF